ncbi:hypothetical protein [Streptomyces sp. NPDC001530]|uniref:hypothetical protein n=1 Tax=Streptomyces sp. NPDC001530 TaxID=3364582 RepID=UPI003692891F
MSKKLAHPHPVDSELIGELRALGPVRMGGSTGSTGSTGLFGSSGSSGSPSRDAAGVDAPVEDVRRIVGDRARVLTGDDRHQADPAAARDAEALVGVNSLLGTAAGVTAFVSAFVTASTFAVGLAASAAGCALGALGAPRLVRALVDGGVAPSWFALRDAAAGERPTRPGCGQSCLPHCLNGVGGPPGGTGGRSGTL